ncbi:MAG: hypothetical protein HOV87_02820 [Catenulispora sp.]|nr:hypothetical protein [Catenulispora sp.]
MSEQPPWETHIQPGWGTPQPPPQQPQQPQQQPPQGGGWNQGPYAPPQQQPQYPPQFPQQYGPPGPPRQDAPPSNSGVGSYPGFGQQPAPPQFSPPQMPGQPMQSAPPPSKGGRNIVFIVVGIVAIIGAAAAIWFFTKDDKKPPQPSANSSTATTPATKAASTPNTAGSFPDNSYTSPSASTTGSPAPASSSAPAAPAGGAALDKDTTDKTPFTPAGMVANTFTDKNNVVFTLKAAGPQPCDKVGDAVVEAIVKSSRCINFMAASWVDPQSQIIVSAMIIPYQDAPTSQKVYQKLGGTAHTGDYNQWCPPPGQPGADACGKLAKTTVVTREGKFGSFHRYLLITTAMYADLRHDDAVKDKLNAAADGAFQNTLPGQ